MTRALVRKVQLGLTATTLEQLDRLQQASGATSMVEVVRAALDLYDWALEQKLQGGSIGSQKPGEPFRELLLFRRARGGS